MRRPYLGYGFWCNRIERGGRGVNRHERTAGDDGGGHAAARHDAHYHAHHPDAHAVGTGALAPHKALVSLFS